MRIKLLFLTILFFQFSLSDCFAEIIAAHQLRYNIFCNQETVGTAKLSQERKNSTVTAKLMSELTVQDNEENYQLVILTESTKESGKLSSCDHWIVDKEQKWHLQGRLVKEQLFVEALQVRNKGEQEINALTNLAHHTVASYTMPYSDVLGLIINLFSSEHSEGTETVPIKEYDTTELELLAYLLDLKPWNGKMKLRIFSTDTLEIEQIQVEHNGREEIIGQAGNYNCAVYTIEARDVKSRIWIAPDKRWGYILIKQEDSTDGKTFITTLEGV